MGYIKPQNSKQEIDAAGDLAISENYQGNQYDEAIKIINNWRVAHSWPMNILYMNLRDKSKSLHRESLSAQRRKRLSSILKKLDRMKGKKLKLSEMQDIGGCRVVVKNVATVSKLAKKLETSNIRHKLLRVDDYIASPKIKTGYRGLHLIYEYFSDRNTTYNGLKIELQLRTPCQHAWATAVETVDAFTSLDLKSSGGKGDWRKFFKLMSTVMAKIERTPPALNTPTAPKEITEKLKKYQDQISMIRNIKTYHFTLKHLTSATNAHYFILIRNSEKKTTKVMTFTKKQSKEADKKSLEVERSIKDKPHLDSVLVSVESIQALKRTYPNYFVDIDFFLKVLDNALDGKFRYPP